MKTRMINYHTSARSSEGDLALGIDLLEQWEDFWESAVSVQLLADAWLRSDGPTNWVAERGYRCLGLVA